MAGDVAGGMKGCVEGGNLEMNEPERFGRPGSGVRSLHVLDQSQIQGSLFRARFRRLIPGVQLVARFSCGATKPSCFAQNSWSFWINDLFSGIIPGGNGPVIGAESLDISTTLPGGGVVVTGMPPGPMYPIGVPPGWPTAGKRSPTGERNCPTGVPGTLNGPGGTGAPAVGTLGDTVRIVGVNPWACAATVMQSIPPTANIARNIVPPFRRNTEWASMPSSAGTVKPISGKIRCRLTLARSVWVLPLNPACDGMAEYLRKLSSLPNRSDIQE